MTPEQFAYWLQGFTELNPSMEQPTPEQWKSIAEHLKTVFVKVTPEVRVVGPMVAEPAKRPIYEDMQSEAMRIAQQLGWPGSPYQVIC